MSKKKNDKTTSSSTESKKKKKTTKKKTASSKGKKKKNESNEEQKKSVLMEIPKNEYNVESSYAKEWNAIVSDVMGMFNNYRDEHNRPAFTSTTVFAKDYGFNRGFPMVLSEKIASEFAHQGFYVGYTAVDNGGECIYEATSWLRDIRYATSFVISLEPLNGMCLNGVTWL